MTLCNLSQEYKWNLTFKNLSIYFTMLTNKREKKHKIIFLDADKASVKFKTQSWLKKNKLSEN